MLILGMRHRGGQMAPNPIRLSAVLFRGCDCPLKLLPAGPLALGVDCSFPFSLPEASATRTGKDPSLVCSCPLSTTTVPCLLLHCLRSLLHTTLQLPLFLQSHTTANSFHLPSSFPRPLSSSTASLTLWSSLSLNSLFKVSSPALPA